MTQETQEINTQKSNKLPTHQIFTFEWDNVLRVIGAITGMVGIAAALLYILGYIAVAWTLESLGISQGYYSVSLSNEYYLLHGIDPFLKFIANVVGLLISYVAARTLVQTVGRDLLKRIKRQNILLIIGIAFGAIFILTGLSSFQDIWGDTTKDAYYGFIFTFTGIDILVITFEIVFVKDDKGQMLINYYKLITSALSTIKVVALGYVIFFVLLFSNNNIVNLGSYYCRYLTENPTSATIHSVHPLGLDGETSSADSYTYNGYYLLYTDNNYYYLFNELDSEKLKPKNISIIKKDAVEAMQLEQNIQPPDWHLTKTCSDLFGN